MAIQYSTEPGTTKKEPHPDPEKSTLISGRRKQKEKHPKFVLTLVTGLIYVSR